FMHLTLVPFLASSGEMKTKPTQHSVKELRSIGIQPDVLLCRVDRPLPDGERRKIALFTNVSERNVIASIDVDDIYKMPALLQDQGLDELVTRHFGLQVPPADLSHWTALVNARKTQDITVQIARVGKYVDLADAYKSVNEALTHAGLHTGTCVQIHYVDSEQVDRDQGQSLANMDAVLVPGGFGGRGIEGNIAAARYARENGLPYLGICLGMQVAAIEFARHVAGLDGAHSTEFDPTTRHPVIAQVSEWQDCDSDSGLPGTRTTRDPMRLGEQQCRLVPDTLASRCYDTLEIHERHRHRYELNNHYHRQ